MITDKKKKEVMERTEKMLSGNKRMQRIMRTNKKEEERNKTIEVL